MSSDHVLILSRIRGRELKLFFINGLWALESLRLSSLLVISSGELGE